MTDPPPAGRDRLAEDAVERALRVVRRREPTVGAFVHLDEAGARERARAVDAGPPGALAGVTLGVKDLVDTADLPTAYGSQLYAGHRPAADAVVVERLVRAGGCVLGKTVTTEFALMTPGRTTNPRRRSHTPGGSSSGSAAAVAAGMVDVGIGTQTYGSLIRPASFCGVLGLKPSFGAVPTTGVRPMAPSFDTVGWMASSLNLIERVLRVLTGAGPGGDDDLRVGTVFAPAVRSLRDALLGFPGAHDTALDVVDIAVEPLDLAPRLEETVRRHNTVGQYEISRSLAAEYQGSRSALSARLQQFIAEGQSIDAAQCAEASVALAVEARAILGVFATVDVIVAPAAVGEAPRGFAYTGDPQFCIPWTALGCPALTVPALTGRSGLPIGVQLVTAPGRDALLMHSARALFPRLT